MVPIWEHDISQYAKGESINCCREGEFVGSCGLIIAMDTHKKKIVSLSLSLSLSDNIPIVKPLIKPFVGIFCPFLMLGSSIHNW
jgi:hypothetical protein